MTARQNSETSPDLSYDHGTAAAWAMPITLALLAAVLVPHAILYRENAFTALGEAAGIWLALPAFLLSVVVHELLHSLAAIVFGGLRWTDISYGVNWKTLTPYAHPRVPLEARAYAATVAAPGVILGVVPAAVGLVTGSGAWSGYGAVMLAAAAGDLLVLWSLRGVPANALVQDHPSRVGCYIVPADRETPLAAPREPAPIRNDLLRGIVGAFLAGVAIGLAAAIAAVLT